MQSAASGKTNAIRRLNKHYLGFIVIRPIHAAPLGRTVMRWYPDDERYKSTPRVVEPAREYRVHLAGILLTVKGLAWQQQDTGVGACATIGLWTMLHSSAFDDHHAIPTTADITRAAHKRASLGTRMFPSTGLTLHQICEAVKEQNLAPVISEGDIQNAGNVIGFSKERFAASCASFIRSGYPVLVIGKLGELGGHAVCAVGFRSCAPPEIPEGRVCLQDSDVEYLYIHDDNIGPSVRFKISTEPNSGVVTLSPDAPPQRSKNPRFDRKEKHYNQFTPTQLLVAVHNDLRTSPDKLHGSGIMVASTVSRVLQTLANQTNTPGLGLALSTRFIKLAGYLTNELANTLGANPKLLGQVRMALAEDVPPMSLHIGVVRIGLDNSTPLIDILYDTTDSDRNHPVYAHVAYSSFMKPLIAQLEKVGVGEYGVCVEAF
ncbi:MAG TPA: hypothetical protein ENI68_01380 [Gammaproteobacteria bacterium]|nr:hypothetical protein [Gammaproteobacteria bacterium]